MSNQKANRCILSFAGSFLLSFVCSSSVNAQEIGNAQQPLIVEKSTIWPTRNIDVCWERTTIGNSDMIEKTWVRDAVEKTWAKESNLRFNWLGGCRASSKGIRIAIADVRPHTTALGNDLDGEEDGMVLNFAFASFSNECQDGGDRPLGFNDPNRISSMTEREFCIKAIAAHEFGHALGFDHEHTRDDAPRCGAEAGGGVRGDLKITPYDLLSVMNYCNPKWNGNGTLSELDINGLVTIYGRNPNSVANIKSNVSAITPVEGGVTIFTVGEEGDIWSAFYDPRVAKPEWTEGFRLSPTKVAGYNTVTAVSPVKGGVSLFTVASDGSVWSAFYDPRIAKPKWTSWFSLGSKVRPGSKISAISAVEGGVSLFIVGTDNAVWSAYFDPTAANPKWSGWFSLGGQIRPDTDVITVSPMKGSISLFAVGQDNAVLSAYYDSRVVNPKWSSWFSLGGKVRPNTDVSAVSAFEGGVSLFTVGEDDTIRSAYYDPRVANPKWSDWFSLGGQIRKGAKLSLVSPVKGGVSLFSVGKDNAVWSAYYDPRVANPKWSLTSLGSSVPAGQNVSAVSATEGGISLFTKGNDGYTRSAYYDSRVAKPKWSDWFIVGQ
jgi:Matrixin